ncbi:MAG: PAS domain S-box protein [Nitratireductor sp.]|nr:PAS domain S-box protein [Nitratireductor sp.]
MGYSDYSYLDLTVMAFLRKRVISQDAAVLFSPEMDRVLWANAFGAKLFSGSGLAELLDVHLSPTHPLVRQIAGAIQQAEDDEPVIRRLRVNHGLNSELILSEMSRSVLPNGEEAVLLVCPHDSNDKRLREHQLAAEAVLALEDFAAASAVLDEFGLVLAASETFEDYEIDTAILEELVQELDGEADRLVKRPVPASGGRMLPAGIGKIRDHPARFLIVLADGTDEEADRLTDGARIGTSIPAEAAGVEADPILEGGLPPWLEPVSETQATKEGGVEGPLAGDSTGQLDSPVPDDESDVAETADSEPEAEESADGMPATSTTSRSLLDRWYFGTNRGDVATRDEHAPEDDGDELPAEPADLSRETAANEMDSDAATDEADSAAEKREETGSAAMARTDSASSRFAFVIDRDQIIRSVSDGLAAAVGERSADIIGKHWKDVAAERGFDEDNAILNLLSKSDTWSGRSVLWPIEGTDMCVPVDLAALPAYDRERNFDGYRGFGVIRLADTMVDPQARGMRLGELADEDDSGTEEDEPDFRTGWSTDIASEDEAAEEMPEPEIDEASGESLAADNVYRLSDRQPIGTDDAREDEDAARDEGSLSGREKRNFSEIRRSLAPADHAPGKTDMPEDSDSADDDLPALRPVGDLNEPDDDAQAGEFTARADTDEAAIIFQGGRTLHASGALLELTGYSDVEALQAAGGLEALLVGGEEAEDQDSRAREDGKRETGMQIRRRDGETVHVRCRLQRLKWADGNALAMSFSEAQPSKAEEKIALDMVRVSELENILDTAADGIVTLDANGLVQSLNPSGEALFGVSQAQVTGEPFVDLFSSESHHPLLAYMESISRNGDESEVQRMMQQGFEATGREANGGSIPLFVTLGKVGREGNLCAVLRDLTDWKKTEQELVKARKQAEDSSEHKTRFLSQVSHEIREPLTAIIGFSDIMLEERFGPVGNERYRDYLRDINRSGGHVLDLVNDLLNISKIESGKLELEFEAVDLNRLVSETVSLLQPQANRRRIITRTSLSQAVPKVVADARSIRQVILNLVGNAINHSPENTQVIVSTALEENGEVALRVRDNGDGMSPAQVKQVLQAGKPFDLETVTRDDQAREAHGKTASRDVMEPGSSAFTQHGLGLPLTKALVEANRAYFELESTQGEGTVVHVLFPSQRVLAD